MDASPIVGICGKPGSGKDTFALRLRIKHGFTRVQIKDSMNAILESMGIPSSHIYDRDKREDCVPGFKGWTARKMLQHIALNFREWFGEDVWVRILWERDLSGKTGRFVVPDVRTTEDASFLKAMSERDGRTFKLVMISRPGCGATTKGGFANHPLESYDLSSECVQIIQNDGTIEKLHLAADEFVNNHLKRRE